ncbi:hypothetical protein [Parafilimonas terrae]|uniref:Uncharacterized protein n=1 Tax=Parafilimonas terrae TaxID=1465490 RepID=A0A1I5UB25_9BACT|nr:hypothetical protein [Parafilimonas terrae]SFP92464.1 hypothetical protein SAMN05444277_103179 [Parafilimonas terrae]
MATNSGYFPNVVLPNNNPSAAEIMARGQQLQANQTAQLAGLMEKQYQKRQQENEAKSQFLYKTFDPAQYQTPDEKANKAINENLQRIQDELLEKSPQLSLPELRMLTQQRMAPVFEVDRAIKTRIESENKNIEDARKEFPNYDYLQLSHEMGNNLINDFFTKNEQGNLVPLAPVQWNNTGTLSYLMNNDTGGRFIKSFDPAYNYFTDAYKNGQKIDPETYQTEHAGVKHIYEVSGQHSPFYQKKEMGANQKPSMELITENLPIRGNDGNYLKAIPQEQMSLINADRERADMFQKLWARERPDSIKPGSVEDDMLMRHWMATVIPQHDPSFLHYSDKQSNADFVNKQQAGVPLYKSNSSTNGGNANGSNWIINTTAAIQSGDVSAMKDQMNKLLAGNGKYKFADFDFIPDSKQILIKYKTGTENVPVLNQRGRPQIDATTGKPKTEKKDVFKTDIISIDDPALESRLTGLYQSMMGSDAKLERNIANNPGNNQPSKSNTPNKKTIPGF